LAYRNSLYIQDACEQLVGIHKQELSQKKLEVAAYPIFQITDSVIRAARDIISACPINIDYGQHKDQTLLWIDFAKVEFIVKSMLSNAFRRIHYQGVIRCSIDREIIDGQEFCIFRIMDDCKETESLLHQNNIMGTSLMKDIAHRHHGNFRVIKKEEGTESLLYIPLGKEHFEKDENIIFVDSQPQTQEEDLEIPVHELQKEEETKDTPTSKNKCKILIVDGNKDTRMFLKLQFANEYTVHLAKNGEEGTELARKILPDLVITEAILPGMDGFEVTRILKEDTNTCQIPIILLTTLNNNEDIIKGMELGADEYVRKPFDSEVLKSKVKRLIKNRLDLKRSYTKLLVPIKEEETTPNGQENENMEDPLVTKVIQLINENIQNEDFSVKKLAEMLNMSQPTLYRKIKQLTNFTLIEVVRGVRLKRAAELLKSKKYNVQEAAEAVGYNDIPTFRKHFVDLYGITPSAFSKEENNEK
jgi:DNA-binding response OmpR family regulator